MQPSPNLQTGQPAERGTAPNPVTQSGPRWFCVVTKPNCQNKATLELHRLGYRTFFPRLKKWVSHARVRKAAERPLLGRYVFVEVDHPRQDFRTVSQANGVEGILSTLGVPTPFPSRWVEGFLQRYLAGEWDFVTQEAIRYRDAAGEVQVRQNGPVPVGARIRIIEGEFDGVLATVTRRKAGKLHCKLLGENSYVQMREPGVRAA